MVVMAADDSDHHKPESKPRPVSPSPSQATPATRPRIFTFPTFRWGAHRLLRCCKDGAPACPPPPPAQTPSPQKGMPQLGAAAAAAATGAASQTPRPWNLRTRRSATAVARSEDAGKASAYQPQPPPHADAINRGFCVALTKKEIVEDFLTVRGARPPRRPKKRPRTLQRQVDMLYPGLPLADVNLNSYKIEER